MDIIEALKQTHKELQKYPLKKQLVIQVLEELRGEDRDDMDLGKVADYLQEISHAQVHQCYYCERIGIDINRYATFHVGGTGSVSKRCCDDVEKCNKNIKLDKSRERYRNES